MRIFISAGEASGDGYGAALVQEIKRISGDKDWTVNSVQAWLGIDGTSNLSVPIASLGEARRRQLKDAVWELTDYLSIGSGEFDTSITLQELVESILSEMKADEFDDWRNLTFEGVGGPKLKTAGVSLHADSSHWGAISLAQGIRVGFGILPQYLRVKRLLKRGPRGLFIPIDFGFANIRLASHAKKQGWKVLYFVPPGSWRRHKQGKDLPYITHEIVTPFKWSAEMLNQMGAKAHWFGHPIKQLLKQNTSWRANNEGRKTIAVLPGSRLHEVELNLPLIAKTVGDQIEGQLEFALAPALSVEQVRQTWNALLPGRNDQFTVGDTAGVLQRAKAGIVCSGTATLEAALCRCPMVVVYILSPAMIREAKFFRIRRPKFISLPNIILDREVVPEYAGVEFVDPIEVRAGLEAILKGGDALQIQLGAFSELDTLLGPDDAITKTAELALGML